ncbi:Cupredoxin [Triangularia verruculosa]|uniref:Cupredoxin n=1 Tax=Triangularia verruculosa TaxID=2587418 RepID=A0AAN6XP49_9PEZI|nr:Cupredoxin [Triangularia verruculosa]
MHSSTLFITLAAALGFVSAAPTDNIYNPTKTYSSPRTTHTVVAGRGGRLIFDPDNIVAEVGSIVEFHFTPRNHSVVESSFSNPCQPKDANSFFSGFFPVSEGQSAEVFQIEVKDTRPIWFYCAQNNGAHCQSGMTGVVNQNFDNQAFSLRAHKELAAKVQGPSGVQANIQGGWRIPNPNPLGGF